MATLLITGATGFIGRHVVAAVIRRGHTPRCLVRTTSNREGLEAFVGQTLDFAVGDMGDAESLRAATQGVDAVLHLASLLKVPWRKEFLTVNAGGTRNVAEACARLQIPMICVSSLAAAGPSAVVDAPRREVDGTAPVSIYGRVKLASEAAAVELAGEMPLSIVRPPMVFGEGDQSVLKLFRSVAKGVHMTPTRRTNHVSFCHAADLAEALLQVWLSGEQVPDAEGWAAGVGIYYAADPARPSYAEFGRMVGVALGVEPRVLRMPRFATWTVAALSELSARITDRPSFLNLDKYREATAGSWICDTAKIEALGFRAAPSGERLEQTAAWYRTHGLLP